MLVYTPSFIHSQQKLDDFDFKNCKSPISHLWYDYPSLKKYGGTIDYYDDIKELLSKYQSSFDAAALELDSIDVYKIFTDETIEYLKNTVKMYAEIFDSIEPSESRLAFRRMNKHCVKQNENLWKRIINKYNWND